MAWRDRPYAQDRPSGYGGGLGIPRPTPIVGRLLLANLALFVLAALYGMQLGLRNPIYRWGALLFDPDVAGVWQIWRWVTYQYLHAGVWHLFWNALGLYFFGPHLERLWGPRRFFYFYTFCGVVAALAFAVMQTFVGAGWLIGASGCVLGCLAACAVLFPHMTVILLLFPVPIRVAAVLFAAVYSLSILADRDLSDAAHLAGMAAGVAWVYAGRRWPGWQLRVRPRVRAGAWEKKLRERERDEQRVDRILDKIRRHGMASLTWWEKRALRQASERLRQFDEQHVRR